MCCKGFIKRVVPFFLTFAAGLFIASFFISVAAPNFQFRRGYRMNHRQWDRQRDIEIQQLREKNAQLEQQMSESDADKAIYQNLDLRYDVPPMPPAPPAPPAPPSVRSVPRQQR